MLVARKNGMLWWQFVRLLKIKGLVHGIFGPDTGNIDRRLGPFNLSLTAGMGLDKVIAWRRSLARSLGAVKPVFTRQVHGDRVLVIDRRYVSGKAQPLERADAVVTATAGLAPVIQVADCQAVLLVDPCRKVVANVHSGWRGSVKGIVVKTVAVMENMGCRPRDLVCAIGPSLGPCCAEFVNYRNELPASFRVFKGPDNRFDFWQVTADQLRKAGVRPRNIYQSRICTLCNKGLFYSWRGQKTPLRFGAALGFVDDG